MSGWAHAISGRGNRPSFLRMSAVDAHTGLAGFVAATLGLYGRLRHGLGHHATTSLLSVALTAGSETFLEGESRLPVPFAQLDPGQTGTGPWSRIHRTSDGWVALDVAPVDRSRLLTALRVDGPDDLGPALAALATTEAVAAVEDAGVPVEIVRTGQPECLLRPRVGVRGRGRRPGTGLAGRLAGGAQRLLDGACRPAPQRPRCPRNRRAHRRCPDRARLWCRRDRPAARVGPGGRPGTGRDRTAR